jgi:hypothetical protein
MGGARKHGWAERIERHPLLLGAIAALIAVGAFAGMSVAAGPLAVRARVEQLAPAWLAVAAAARLASYLGYAIAHRCVTGACDQSALEADDAMRVAAFGAGPTSLKSGFSIDARALRGAGASRREARAHVAALALLEYAVLALGAWCCSLVLLGEPEVRGIAVLPWAIGVPVGVALAIAAWPWLRARDPNSRLRSLAAGAEILACEWRRPVRALLAVAGMTLYWAAEAGALWASLRAFGISCSPSVAILGYATAYVLTPRGLPLAGAGISEVLVPVSLMWLGVPLAAAVPAALAAELIRLGVSIPVALHSRKDVNRLVGLEPRRTAASAGGPVRPRPRVRSTYVEISHTRTTPPYTPPPHP